MSFGSAFDYAENVVLAQDENLVPVDADLDARVFREEHRVADLTSSG